MPREENVARTSTSRPPSLPRRLLAGLLALAPLGACQRPEPPKEQPAPIAATSQKLVLDGFHDTVVFSNLTNPTAVRFAPDGRIFVAEKRGRILVYSGPDDSTPTLFADLSTNVYDYWDRGLIGLAIHPQFPTVPYVYVSYTHDAPVGGTAPTWNDACPTPPDPQLNGCVASARVSRLEAQGDVMTGTEQVLLESWAQQFPSHSIGDLAFGADGALYVSAGDAASFDGADYGQKGSPKNPLGDPPAGVGGTMTPPTARGGALRSQSPRRPAGEPVLLHGTVIRIDPTSGAAASGNPWAASPDANRRRIVAYGLRNPFRLTVRPGTSEIWVGDVGWDFSEEIDRIPAPTDATVENFGWPCYEGAGKQSSYDAVDLELCESLYAAGGVTAPYYGYAHGQEVVTGDACSDGSSSISGLAFYTGGSYPASYQGALFFSDYSRKCIWVMRPNAAGLPDPANISTFASGTAAPVDLQIGPGGDLFYADISGGTVHRIRYAAPTAVAMATPTSGQALPLAVSFDGSGSTPGAAGGPLTYAWDLDGDGAFDDGTGATVSFTYTARGAYDVRLRVTDASGASGTSGPLRITVGGAPAPVIASPTATTTWAVGDPIAFSGSATDPEDGTLPASAFNWQVIMQHCPANECHPHEVESFSGVASGNFVAPDHEYPSYMVLRLTVTDSDGIRTVTERVLQPRTVDLTFQADPVTTPGLSLAVGASAAAAPFTRTVIVGSKVAVAASAPQTIGGEVYRFWSWSDGGAQSHELTAPATNTTYTARFVPGGGTGLKGEYFDNMDFTGYKLTRHDGPIAFNWNGGSPAASIGNDTFSVRWTGQIQARFTETVTFHPYTDDGVRLWIGGTKVVDHWQPQGPTERPGSIALVAGQKYDVLLEYFENGGGAVAELRWSSPSFAKEVVPATQLYPQAGFKAEYFSNATLSGAPTLVRTDEKIDFSWNGGAPAPSLPTDNFSARWTAKVQPRFSETYTFHAYTDDGVRVWVNGAPVVDAWIPRAPTESPGSIDLVAGQKYDIKVEYFELTGGATAQLSWSSPSQAKEIVPATQLYRAP